LTRAAKRGSLTGEGAIMTCNLKALGLVLTAMLTMSSLGASAAQAVPKFTGEETPGGHVHTIIRGTTKIGSIERFFFGSLTYDCHVTYESTLFTGEEEALNVQLTKFTTPDTLIDGHCQATSGGSNFKGDIDLNGCHNVLHITKKISETMEYTGTVDIVCNTESKKGPITLKVTKSGGTETKCTIKVPAQNGLSHVIYKVNTEKPTDVTVVAAVSKANGKGITFTSEGGLLNCGIADGEHVEGAEYTGEVTVTGTNAAGEPIDVDIGG
jgi:hypothetical protein